MKTRDMLTAVLAIAVLTMFCVSCGPKAKVAKKAPVVEQPKETVKEIVEKQVEKPVAAQPVKEGKKTFEEWSKNIKKPFVRVNVPAKPPVIDGKIDAVYKEKGTPLVMRLNSGSTRRPNHPTTAYVLADKSNLYVAVYCETKNLGKILADKTKRDDQVWEDEVVDLFIDPKNSGGSDYFHIIVNSAGIIQDGKGQSDSSWNPLLTVKCGKEEKKAWIMEIKIPLKELDIDAGKINTVWSFNVNRTWRDPDDTTIFEDLAWSPTETRTSHVPSMFGYLWVNAGE